MEWWVLIPIAAGFAALIWFLVWLSKKYPKSSMDTWIPVAKAISDGVGYVIKAFDKDPKNESNTERIYRYASIAVASVEQAWKKIREKMDEGEKFQFLIGSLEACAVVEIGFKHHSFNSS